MSSMADKTILLKTGQNIKKYRKIKKLSQEKLAEKIDVHETTIGRIETGKINASLLMLQKIAGGLDIPLKDLFDFE